MNKETEYEALREKAKGFRYKKPASMDILREKNAGILKMVKVIDEQYEKAEESTQHFELNYSKDLRDLDRMLAEVPQEYWIQ